MSRMDKDSPKRIEQGADPSFAQRDDDSADAEESLSEALSGLERILVKRQRRSRPQDVAPGEPAARESAQRPPADDAQYTIPMLNEVVAPGDEIPPLPAAGAADVQPPEAGPEEEELCRRLTERLANEIEVLVQARIETAVQEAAGDIREQVRNHLEIMLPEILEELNALGRRRHS